MLSGALMILLPELLSDLFCPERSDAIQSKTENEAILVTQAHIEGVVLDGESAAIEAVPGGENRTDERGILLSGTILEIEEERDTAEESALAVPDED